MNKLSIFAKIGAGALAVFGLILFFSSLRQLTIQEENQLANVSSSAISSVPNIVIASPTSGAILKGDVNVSATVTANSNVVITSVQFNLDGSNVGQEVTASPYVALWHTTNVADGSHILVATVHDSTGKTKTSAPITVTISNNATTSSSKTISSSTSIPPTSIQNQQTNTNTNTNNTNTLNAGLTWRSPHGTFMIDDPYHYGTNSAMNGLRLQVKWSDIEISEGVYDFTWFDKVVDDANNIYHKQVIFSLWTLTSPPSWILSKQQIQKYTLTDDGLPMIMPWDSVAQAYLRDYIIALCNHFDGRIDGIVMGDFAPHTETYMPTPIELTPYLHDANGTQLTLAQEAALWVQSSEFFIDTYAAHLNYTPFIMAGGVPFPNNDPSGSNIGTNSITTVFQYGQKYGVHFGLMHWGLNMNSDVGYIINDWIKSYSLTNPVGFQFTGNSLHTVGGDLGCVGQPSCVSKVLDAGVALKTQWIEVYPVDGNNTAYAPTFAYHTSIMQPSPAEGSSDKIPPIITNVLSTGITTNSVSISWNTDENSDSQVFYGLTNQYGQSTTLDPTLKTSHNVAINGLTANTTYHYKVQSYDAAGNLAVSSDKTFTTSQTSTYSLTVTKSGLGLGIVTSNPSGIDCGITCAVNFNQNSTITLTASPLIGSTFAGWSGGGCTGTGPCIVTLLNNTTVTAAFNLTSDIPPVLNLIGPKTVNEGNNLNFVISATDANGDPLTYSAKNLPTGATFNSTTRTFNGTPGFTDSGIYTLNFTVDDGRGGTDSETVILTVKDINRGGKHLFIIPLYPGTSGSEVVELQNVLISYGYLAPGLNTGYFGSLTRDAVGKFQIATGIFTSPLDDGYGLVGPRTRAMLNSI